MITGVVLAAGRSRRMGRPKPLLHDGNRTFLAHSVDALREGGCDEVWVVVPAGADATVEEAAVAGAQIVLSPCPEAEQVDSLRLALAELSAVDAVVVTPVDVPRFRAGTVRALIDAFRAHPAPVVLPLLRGRHGHPTLFARSVFPEFRGELGEGARSIVHAHRADLEEVPVADEGVLWDVDTPADYQRLIGGDGALS